MISKCSYGGQPNDTYLIFEPPTLTHKCWAWCRVMRPLTWLWICLAFLRSEAIQVFLFPGQHICCVCCASIEAWRKQPANEQPHRVWTVALFFEQFLLSSFKSPVLQYPNRLSLWIIGICRLCQLPSITAQLTTVSSTTNPCPQSDTYSTTI